MADLEKLVPLILAAEGGWSNHPADRGGATMCGITYKTFCSWRTSRGKGMPTTDDLRNISQEEWKSILECWYWRPWHADQIEDQTIANALVDYGWASGTGRAITNIQRNVLGVSADGICGKMTIDAINSQDPNVLIEKIKEERLRYIRTICESNPSQKVFLKGWTNRIEKMCNRNNNG